LIKNKKVDPRGKNPHGDLSSHCIHPSTQASQRSAKEKKRAVYRRVTHTSQRLPIRDRAYCSLPVGLPDNILSCGLGQGIIKKTEERKG